MSEFHLQGGDEKLLLESTSQHLAKLQLLYYRTVRRKCRVYKPKESFLSQVLAYYIFGGWDLGTLA